MAIHSRILAWRIPWTEEPGRLQSMGSQRIRHDWATKTSLSFHFHGSGTLLGELERWVRKKFIFLLRCLQTAPAAAKSLQSCPTLCNPIDGSQPGCPIPGILQARKLEWVAISFSNAWKWKDKVKLLNHVRLLATPWTAAYQAPLSMGFSRQEYWSGVPLPSLVYKLAEDKSGFTYKFPCNTT